MVCPVFNFINIECNKTNVFILFVVVGDKVLDCKINKKNVFCCCISLFTLQSYVYVLPLEKK